MGASSKGCIGIAWKKTYPNNPPNPRPSIRTIIWSTQPRAQRFANIYGRVLDTESSSFYPAPHSVFELSTTDKDIVTVTTPHQRISVHQMPYSHTRTLHRTSSPLPAPSDSPTSFTGVTHVFTCTTIAQVSTLHSEH